MSETDTPSSLGTSASGASHREEVPIKVTQTVPSPIVHGRKYTILGLPNTDTFGFGSSAPARSNWAVGDVGWTPGPGTYDPVDTHEGVRSLRGYGTGFTSTIPRRAVFGGRNKNPAPVAYTLKYGQERRIPKQIGEITGRRCVCFPDPRETSAAPGPGSYEVPGSIGQGRAISSVFKSRSKRQFGPEQKRPVRFDGRTFTIFISDGL